ncbi:spermidine/putrescine ABC transporter ATPase [Jannaschia pagri]|uniref:Spermidine/putrescine ABC transporter ATPase n=1 Tax=Jannaschia pagri TaxID=2829797 RepID=A0ABQ4NNL6_9RHOB|nr:MULTISPECIES: ABC transporter ATP-binding protein [unclassified Jannaschia]GIT92173.1 spermidine/putrescine ABC transporter ATPase [Jannaschia sp. AI_61]GIT96008.1 spermidine/putrescine ABC transporter ATPase [Jannaschia sp. AI_62]
MEARLRTEGLVRRFRGETVVDGIDLAVAPGKVTCLLGPSGCGKSTTLRIIAGVDRQDAGCVWLNGEVVSDDTRHLPPEARGVGLMFQDFALFPHLTVAQNVAFGLPKRQAAGARVAELLAKVDLTGYDDKHPHELSGGEQQRVALARALAPRPRVMLMDEPFSGLDNRLRDGIRDATLAVLKEEGTAVLLVTHEPDEAMRMADEIALMRGGKIVQQAAPYNIYNAPIDPAAAAFFSDINKLSGVVHGALTQTPFGQFLAPGVPDGTAVDIIFRPQHVRIDFDRQGRGPNPTASDGAPARGVVQRARFMGKESLVEFLMDDGVSVVTATVPAVFLPKEGTILWLSIRRDRCFVFPR